MNLPHWALHLPQIYGQIFLAVLMLTTAIFSYWDKRRREQREEARESARKIEMAEHRALEEARQEELAKNLVTSQQLVETHAALLKKDLEDVKRELAKNTELTVEGIAQANGYNEKIAQVVELAASIPTIQQVEIVQPADHPVLVKDVDG